MDGAYNDEAAVRAAFDGLVAGLPDAATLYGSGTLDDTILTVLVERSAPLPEGLLPRGAVAAAVIGALLYLDYLDRPEQNRLTKAVRRHQPMLDSLVQVSDYPHAPLAADLGVDVLPCSTALTVIWLDTGPHPGWLAAQLAGIFAPPRWYTRPPGDPWTTTARDVAERLRRHGDD